MAQAVFDAKDWLRTLMKDCKVSAPSELVPEKLRCKNNEFCTLIKGAAKIIEKLLDHNQLQLNEKQELRQELMKCQSSVIDLQKQVIHEKDVQLQSLTTVVSEKVCEVKTEVKAEFEGYSAALKSQGGCGSGGETFTTSAMKTVVRTALADEADEKGRVNNVVLFGLEEEQGENVSDKVSEVFNELSVKPKFEATRIGVVKSDGSIRPVKVVLKNSATTREIIAKAVKLRGSELFKSVYISPDRTPEQRAAQRDLVGEVKRRRGAEPDKKHFIRGGVVVSLEGK